MNVNRVGSPRFSGFYEVKADEETLDKLPIGTPHGAPYFNFHTPSISPASWVVCQPQYDEKIETALKDAELEYDTFSKEYITENHMTPIEKRTLTESSWNDTDFLAKVGQRWSNARIDKLMAEGMRNTFRRFLG